MAIAAGYSEDDSPSSYSFHRAVQAAPPFRHLPFEELRRPKD